MGTDERVQAFPRCESCGGSATGGHGAAIGGGWADMCDDCAARLCACGAFVLERDDMIGGGSRLLPFSDACDGFALHGADRCTGPAGSGESAQAPPAGVCRCDACHDERIRGTARECGAL